MIVILLAVQILLLFVMHTPEGVCASAGTDMSGVWELVNRQSLDMNTGVMITERVYIRNGWLVRTVVVTSNGVSVNQIFVNDIDREWKLKR